MVADQDNQSILARISLRHQIPASRHARRGGQMDQTALVLDRRPRRIDRRSYTTEGKEARHRKGQENEQT